MSDPRRLESGVAAGVATLAQLCCSSASCHNVVEGLILYAVEAARASVPCLGFAVP